ncbi:glycosyl hydrolase family 28 [Apiospora phragmitis]|uniref:galacturonan 1,4-alpha-galacturonidase n=1 Tax=Apiospora phragmitis TaxID=2905665 RepID=A0ABR1X6X1_9PEZI
MRSSSILLALSAVMGAIAHHVELPPNVPRNIEEFRAKHPYKRSPKDCGTRPIVQIRASQNDTDDVADDFLEGLHKANHGGTLYLPQDELYVIGQPLDLTFLDDVQIHWDGEVKFTNDTHYWQAHAFAHPFQNSLMFWRWGGRDVRIYGEGVLNVRGAEILDPDNTYLRPILFYGENLTNFEMEGIHEKDSPCWTNFVVTSKNVTFRDVLCTAVSNNATALPKNSDFFDSLNIEDLTVERVWVNIGDDCFSPKSNATNVHPDMTNAAPGTHGQSMGSLGQYSGEFTFVQDVVIENLVSRTWAGPDIGYGFIDNVTFRNFWQANNEYSAFIDSCYFNINSSTCAEYPSKMNITNILGKYGMAVARLTCSTNPDAVCENIEFRNFTVQSPCGGGDGAEEAKPVIICDGIKGGIGMDCIPAASDAAQAALKKKCSVPLAEIDPPF